MFGHNFEVSKTKTTPYAGNLSQHHFTSDHAKFYLHACLFTPATRGLPVHQQHHHYSSQHVRSLWQTGMLFQDHDSWLTFHPVPLVVQSNGSLAIEIITVHFKNMCAEHNRIYSHINIVVLIPLNLSLTEGYDVTVFPTPMPWATSAVGPELSREIKEKVGCEHIKVHPVDWLMFHLIYLLNSDISFQNEVL